MSGLIRAKLKDPKEWRDCALLAKRYDAKEGVKAGIVDLIVDISSGETSPEKLIQSKAMEFAKKLKLGQLASRSKHIYGLLKESLYYPVLQNYEQEKDRIIDMRDFLKFGKL